MTSPLLELDHVTKRFGRGVIAEQLSFSVGAGDTVGIVGPNGAGKTSLFGLISGDLSPDAGEISFAARPATKTAAAEAPRCRPHLPGAPAVHGHDRLRERARRRAARRRAAAPDQLRGGHRSA